jgi:hypothetical protein
MDASRKLTISQLWIAAVAVTTLILACTPKADPHSVEYYLDNKDARLQRIKECDNNPGALKDDPDCINARQATIRAWSKPNLKPFNPSSASGQAGDPSSSSAGSIVR